MARHHSKQYLPEEHRRLVLPSGLARPAAYLARGAAAASVTGLIFMASTAYATITDQAPLEQQSGKNNPLKFPLPSVNDESKPALVDIDNDGDFDLFVGGVEEGIAYFENTGTADDPIFTERTGAGNPMGGENFCGVPAPSFVDIDNDGDMDLFVGQYDYLRYFENTGTAAAPLFVERTGDANPFDIVSNEGQPGGGLLPLYEWRPVFADLDGDGDMDAYIGTRGGEILFFENTGTAQAPVFDMQVNEANPFFGLNLGKYTAPAFADIDGDGDLDAFIGNTSYLSLIDYSRNQIYQGNVTFLENTGSRTAPEFSIFKGILNGDFAGPPSPALADMDGDGDIDVLAGRDDGAIDYFANAGDATGLRFEERTGADNPLTGIEDDSLRPDPPAPAPGELFPYEYGEPWWDSKPFFANLDGDGDLDAVVGVKYNARVFENTGSSTTPVFEEVRDDIDVPVNFAPGGVGNGLDRYEYFHWSPALVDIDGDGDLDMFFGNKYGNVLFYENTGTQWESEFELRLGGESPLGSIGGEGYYHATPAFGDLDGDGDLDAVIGGKYDRPLRFFENVTGEAVARPEPVAVAQFTERNNADNPLDPFRLGYFTAPAFIDIDGDGDLDMVVGNKYGPPALLENIGTSTAPAFVLRNGADNPFSAVRVGNDNGKYRSGPAFADIDGDGDLDLFLGGEYGGVQFFENTRQATHPDFTLDNGFDAGSYSRPVFADIDGDGDLDAFSVGQRAGFYGNPQAINPEFQAARQQAFLNAAGVDVQAAAAESGLDLDAIDLQRFAPEIAALDEAGVFFYKNTGSDTAPKFEEQFNAANPLNDLNDRFAFFTLADIDGDGDLDAFAGGYVNDFDAAPGAADPERRPDNVRFFRNTGSAASPVFTEDEDNNPLDGVNINQIAGLTLVDIDGDGDLDAFATGRDYYGPIFYYQNTGSDTAPVFEKNDETNPLGTVFGATNNVMAYSLAFADVDGDGDLDAVIGAADFGGIPGAARNIAPGQPLADRGLKLYQNTGSDTSPVFEAVDPANDAFAGMNQNPAYYYLTPAFVDIDGDGDLDVFAGEEDGRFLFFKNLAQAEFQGGEKSDDPTVASLDTASWLPECFIQTTVEDAGSGNLFTRAVERIRSMVTTIFK